MGVVINFLRGLAERIAKENKSKLYIGGLIITFLVVSLSGMTGWIIERLFLFFEIKNPILSTLFFGLIISSSLASRSLNKSILEILNIIKKENNIDNLSNLRQKLSLIVGRDVENLDINEILRALAETASENSVDGIFAPLFWMFLGTIFWEFNQSMPGPLAMSWIFKASSTIDSMNDTVVVYDRIRENLRKYKQMNIFDLINQSLNETMSRTLLTSVTTLLALFSLYFLGGEVLKGFTLAMIIGVFIGTYSSVFIASQIILYLNVKRDWSKK